MQAKQKILILEDDLLTQDVYRAVFSRRSDEYDFVLCKDEQEFYASLNENHFDVFLIDLALGIGKDGVQLIKELRQKDEYKSSPVIVITAFAMLKDERVSMEAGATKFLRKPLEITELFEYLHQIPKREANN